jgi:hypothetical protein
MHQEAKNDTEIRVAAKNKITAIGTSPVPVLRYSFGITTLRLEEIRKIDKKTGRVLTVHKMHHSEVDIDRLYVQRKGGRGLLQIDATYKAEIISIVEYLNTKYAEYQFVSIVKGHESIQPHMN